MPPLFLPGFSFNHIPRVQLFHASFPVPYITKHCVQVPSNLSSCGPVQDKLFSKQLLENPTSTCLCCHLIKGEGLSYLRWLKPGSTLVHLYHLSPTRTVVSTCGSICPSLQLCAAWWESVWCVATLTVCSLISSHVGVPAYTSSKQDYLCWCL